MRWFFKLRIINKQYKIKLKLISQTFLTALSDYMCKKIGKLPIDVDKVFKSQAKKLKKRKILLS